MPTHAEVIENLVAEFRKLEAERDTAVRDLDKATRRWQAAEADYRLAVSRYDRDMTEAKVERNNAIRESHVESARRQKLEAELRQWQGCPSCHEDHPEGTMCPPHEVRTTGMAWHRQQTRRLAYRAEKAERELEQERVQLAGCLTAAEGATHDPAKQGDYGWSLAYQRTLELFRKAEKVEKQRDWARETAVRLEQELAEPRNRQG